MKIRINHHALFSYLLLPVGIALLIWAFIAHPIAALIALIGTLTLIYAALGVAIALIAAQQRRNNEH